MFSILTKEIKNTRFFLTFLAVFGIGVAGLSVVYLTILGAVVNDAMLTVFTTIVGALIGLTTTAYSSYFKDKQTAEVTASTTSTTP